MEVELVPQVGGSAVQWGGGPSCPPTPWPCQLVVHQHTEEGGLEERKGNSVAFYLGCVSAFPLGAAGPSLSAGAHACSPPLNQRICSKGHPGEYSELMGLGGVSRGWEDEII